MKIADLFMDIRVRRGKLKQDLDTSRKEVERFSTKGGRALSSIAGRFIGATVAAGTLTKVLRDSVRVSAAFEKQMAFVSTMLSARQMPMMTGLARSVTALSTRWGESTETLSKGLYDILSASISAQKAIGVLDVSVMAAKGGFTTTAVAADAITTILNAYQYRAEEASKVSDIMFATVKRGKTTYDELASSVGRVAGVASLAGLKFEELSAAIATMTRAGHNTWMTMTSLMGLLQAILDPQEDAIEVAKRYGIELSARALKEKGLLHILRQLQGASVEDLNAIAGRIRGFKALAALVADQTGYEKDLALTMNATGLAGEAAAKNVDTLANRWQRLKATYEAFIRLPIGGAKMNLLQKEVTGAMNLLQTGTEAFTGRGGERRLEPEPIWKAFHRRQLAQRQQQREAARQAGLDRLAQFRRIGARVGGGIKDILGFGAGRAREIPGALAAINEQFMARRRMESRLLEMRLRNEGKVKEADIEAAKRAHETKVGLARQEYGERLKQTPLYLRGLVEGEQREFERLAEQLLQANIKAIEKQKPKRMPAWRLRDLLGPEPTAHGLLGPQTISTWGGRLAGRDPMAKTEQLLADIRLILRNQERRDREGLLVGG